MDEPLPREVLAFNAALLLSANERSGYLDEACADDHEFRRRIEELLRAHERAGVFLQDPAEGLTNDAGAAGQLEGVGEKCGDWVGRYKLLQQIGEGGCGIVYMAEQEE